MSTYNRKKVNNAMTIKILQIPQSAGYFSSLCSISYQVTPPSVDFEMPPS